MKSLLERSFGSIAFAKRWIEYVRERKTLRGKIQMLERHTEGYRKTIRRDIEQIGELVAVIKDLKQAQRQLPAEVITLLDTARSLIEVTATGRALPSFEFHAWLGEYRAFRFNGRQGRHE